MEQNKRKTLSFPAPEYKGSFKKICDTAQMKDELNEERNRSFDKKHQTSNFQNPMSDKQMPPYEKFSEDGVWDYDNWYESKMCPDPPLPPFSLQQNKPVSQSPVSSSKTRLSWTTAQHDPSSLTFEDEIRGGGCAWPLPNSAQILTDPHIHNLESGIGHMTSDAPQAEKEDFNEDQKKSTSISEKQRTAVETVSEEGVWAKVPSKRLQNYPDTFLPLINSAIGGKGEKREKEREDHHGQRPLSKHSRKITDTLVYYPSVKKLLTTKPQGKAIVPPIAGLPHKPKTRSNSAPYSSAFMWDDRSPHEPWSEMSYGGAWSRPSPSDSLFSLSSDDSWLDDRRHKSKIRKHYSNRAAKGGIVEKRDHVLPSEGHPSFKLADTPLSLSSSSDKLLKELSQSKVTLPSVAIQPFPQNSTMFPGGSSKEKQREKAYPSKVTEPEFPFLYGLPHEMTGGGHVWPGSSSAQRLTDPHIHNLESRIGHMTSDAPQAEKEDFNEDQKKSTSISEKQRTAVETVSEEGVWAKVPSKRLQNYPDTFLPLINSAIGGKGEKREKEREDHHGQRPLSKHSRKITDTLVYYPSVKKLLTTKPQGKAIVPPIAGLPHKPKTRSNSAPYSSAFMWDDRSPHEPWSEMSYGGAWSRPSPSDSLFSLSSDDSWLDDRRHKSKIRKHYSNRAAKGGIVEKRDHVLPSEGHPSFKLADTPLSLSSSSDKLLKESSQSKVTLPSVAIQPFPQNSTMFPGGSSKEKQREKAYPSKVTEPEFPFLYGLPHEMTGGGHVWPGSSSAQRLTDPHVHNLKSGLGHLTSDAPQAEKEDFNEHQKKSLYRDQGCLTSISEKQMTAGETFSEEGDRAKVPSKRFQHYLDISLPPINSAKSEKGEKREKEKEDHHGHHIGYSEISGPRKMADAPICHPSYKKLCITELQGGVIVPPVPGHPGQQNPWSNSSPYSSAFMWDDRSPHEPWNEMSYGGAWSRPSPSDSLFSLSSDDSWLDNRRHKSKIRKHFSNHAAKGGIVEKRDHVLPSEGHPSFKLADTPLSLSSSSDKLLKESSQSKVTLPSVAIQPFPQNSTMFPDGSGKEKLKEKPYPSKVTEPEFPFLYGLPHEMTGGGHVWPGSSSAQRLTDPHIHNLESGIGHMTSDALQAEKEDFSEDQKKSLYKDQEHQTSISEKQMTAGETVSEEGVRAKVPSKRLRNYPDIFFPPINSAIGEKGEKRKKEREDHHGHHFGYSDISGPRKMTDAPICHPSYKKLCITESQGGFIVPPVPGHPGQQNPWSNSAPYSSAFRWDGRFRPSPSDSPFFLSSQDSWQGSRAQDAFEPLSLQSEGESGGDSDAPVNLETAATAVKSSVTNIQQTQCPLQLSSSDPGWSERDSSCLSRSHSVPSLSQTTSPENKTFTRSQSLPDMLLKSSFEEFTPDIIDDEDDETYWFQCSCPGLYQCSVTGLVFHMEGEGDVVYRTVPWDRRLLAQHHKQPAGPLFDIKCLQQSVCQLHLPHCEIRSTGGCEFLSVAHVNDEDIEFIVPQKITETHVIINITGFSAFGNVKDEDSPPDPVRALVLLFYRPPADPDPESFVHVFLLPVNIVVQDVVRTWNKLAGDEIYIKMPPYCKLRPKQEYTLSTCPEDDSVLVQPKEEEFDCDNYDNYFPSFQVILEKLMKHIKLCLRETKSSKSVWERRVCLSSTAVKRSCGLSALNLPPNDRLLDIRSSFIDGISGPVLKSLLDKLLEKTVLTDSERESADEIQNHRDKARFVIDTVRKKGEAASSEMMEFLCEVDPFFCKHLGLI